MSVTCRCAFTKPGSTARPPAACPVPGLAPGAVAQQVLDSGLAFDQLILELDRWVHLALGQGTGRRQVLTLREGAGYLPGLQ